MNSQLNKLMTFILPLILLCHSTLQAAGCPCCVMRSCLSPTSEHSAARQKTCCQLPKVDSNQKQRGTCCSRATRQSNNQGPAESTSLLPNDSNKCDCCIDLPGLSPTPSVPSTTLVLSFISPLVPDILWKPATSTQRITKQLLPVETNRRLATLSCWRK